jgi:hypothetical protein
MTMHDSSNSLRDAVVEARKPPIASEEEECSKCRRKSTDYSDFRRWELNLATDEAFCPDCITER